MKLVDVPELEGWKSLPDAARMLDISRQRIHQRVLAGEFLTVRRIGTFLIVREAEVLAPERSGGPPVNPDEVPELEGWKSLPEAADMMGISRQRIHQRWKAGEFATVQRIGTFLIIREAEVTATLTP